MTYEGGARQRRQKVRCEARSSSSSPSSGVGRWLRSARLRWPPGCRCDFVLTVRKKLGYIEIAPGCRETWSNNGVVHRQNDDDHLRNHGFIRDPRLSGWRLSPLYDVVPRPGVAHERQLHLSVGERGRQASLDNAITLRAAFSLERPEAIAVIAQVVQCVANWRNFFETLHLKARLLDQISSAFRDLPQVAGPELLDELAAVGRDEDC